MMSVLVSVYCLSAVINDLRAREHGKCALSSVLAQKSGIVLTDNKVYVKQVLMPFSSFATPATSQKKRSSSNGITIDAAEQYTGHPPDNRIPNR